MDDPEDRACIIHAIKSACKGTASVFKLSPGHLGADILAVLPLSGKQCMLFGIEPHEGSGPCAAQAQVVVGRDQELPSYALESSCGISLRDA